MDKELKSLVKEMVFTSPLPLLTVREKEIVDYANSFLPYSTGFEIECFIKNYSGEGWGAKRHDEEINKIEEVFKSIPDIVHVNIDTGEQRYRIPNGLRGIICLYNICEQLKYHSELNLGSGIHYHVDMTDIPEKYQDPPDAFYKENSEWILNELDTWGYKGTYNKREVSDSKGHWMVFRGKTIEFRCGEMTFEYQELIKRITHANDIVYRTKNIIYGNHIINYENINHEQVLTYMIKASRSINEAELTLLHREIEALSENHEKPLIAVGAYKEIINKRIVKINGRE